MRRIACAEPSSSICVSCVRPMEKGLGYNRLCAPIGWRVLDAEEERVFRGEGGRE